VRVSKDGPGRDCPLISFQTATIELVLSVIASASEAIHCLHGDFFHLARRAGEVALPYPSPLSGRVGHSEAEAGVGAMQGCPLPTGPHPTHRIAALTMRHPPHEDGGGMKIPDAVAMCRMTSRVNEHTHLRVLAA
jgi:hypothetical protein